MIKITMTKLVSVVKKIYVNCRAEGIKGAIIYQSSATKS
jgi:hypothetical protein